MRDTDTTSYQNNSAVTSKTVNLAYLKFLVCDTAREERQQRLTIWPLSEGLTRNNFVRGSIRLPENSIRKSCSPSNDQRHGFFSSMYKVLAMERKSIIVHLRGLNLLTPSDGKRMRGPKTNAWHVKVNMLTSSKLPGASQSLRSKVSNKNTPQQ